MSSQQLSRHDLVNLRDELQADEVFSRDLTDRRRPGHALALRQWRAVNSKILELDGMRPAANAQELRDAFSREQYGELPPNMQTVQDGLRAVVGDPASASAGGRSSALLAGGSSDKVAKAKETRERMLSDKELFTALTQRRHPKHEAAHREFMEATSVLEAADAAAAST